MLQDGVERDGLELLEAGEGEVVDLLGLSGGRCTLALMELRATTWKSLEKVPTSFWRSLAYLSESFSLTLSLSLMVVVLKTSMMRFLGFSSRKM